MRTLLLVGIVLCAAVSSVALGGNASANGNRLLLVTYWGEDKVALVDIQGAKGKEEVWSIDVLRTAGCAKPYDVRVNKRGSKAFVSCSGNDQIAVIDLVAQMVEYKVKTGSSPRDLQLYADDTRLVVANSGSDTVSVVDIPNRKVLYDISVSLQPYGIAVADNGKTGLVTGWASGDLHVLALGDTSGHEVRKIKIGMLPYTVVVAPDGRSAYVAANGEHAVIGVDFNKGKLLSTTPVGRNPWSLAVNPATNTMLVTNNKSANLSLLKTGEAPAASSVRVANTIAAGSDSRYGMALARGPKNAAITSDGKVAAFTDLANNQVVIANLTTGELTRIIDVGKAPYGIEFIPSVE